MVSRNTGRVFFGVVNNMVIVDTAVVLIVSTDWYALRGITERSCVSYSVAA